MPSAQSPAITMITTNGAIAARNLISARPASSAGSITVISARCETTRPAKIGIAESDDFASATHGRPPAAHPNGRTAGLKPFDRSSTGYRPPGAADRREDIELAARPLLP